MPSSVTIISAKPNNNPIIAMVQLLDADGGKIGAPTVVGILDDNEQIVLTVHPRRVVLLCEGNRNVAAEIEPEPAVAAEPLEPPIPVIGHELAAAATAPSETAAAPLEEVPASP
jgi:hypothetical protein